MSYVCNVASSSFQRVCSDRYGSGTHGWAVHDAFERMDTLHIDASAVEVKALPRAEAESKEDVPEANRV